MSRALVFAGARRMAVVAAWGAGMASGSAWGTIQSVELGYAAYYQQTGPTSVPTLLSYTFESRLVTDNDADAFQAFVRPLGLSGAPTRELEDQDGGLTYQFISQDYASETAVRASFPAGAYQFSISGGDLGNVSSNFNGPSTMRWPVVTPRFFSGTYNALGNVNAYVPFTFAFNAMSPPSGATSSATIFTIYDLSGGVVYQVSLPPTAQSHTIPAETLFPEDAYIATVQYTVYVTTPNAAFGTASGIHSFTRATSAEMFTSGFCVPDFDQNGVLTPQDIFDFLNAWFGASSVADLDGMPGLTTQDVFAFLNLWFAGNC